MQSIAVSIQMNWRLVANSLMRPLIVVLILPELEIVASLLGGTKPHLVKQLLVVSTITARGGCHCAREKLWESGHKSVPIARAALVNSDLAPDLIPAQN